MTDVLDRFAKEYQAYHSLSVDRCGRQQRELRAFAERAGKPLIECGTDDLAGYLADLMDEGLHVNTVRRRGNMIRPFFTWAYGAGLIDGDRLMAVRAVRNPNGSSPLSLPKPYSAKDLKRWRAELDGRYPLLPEHRLSRWRTGRARYAKIADHATRLQIEAIVGLALYCGLRRAEIGALTIEDMHPENAYVVVRSGKGGKAREVPHTSQSREKVETWLAFRDELRPSHRAPWLSLAPNQPGGGWRGQMSHKRYEGLLGTVGDWQLHRFRHTCATAWLRAGMDLHLVSRLLGHSNITQTLGYAEIVRDDIQRAVEKHEAEFERQVNGDG